MTISRIDKYIMEKEGLGRLTRQDIEAMQLEKLNRLLRREKERAGFYKALPSELASLSQLAELCDPPVSKSCMNHRLRKLNEEAKKIL